MTKNSPLKEIYRGNLEWLPDRTILLCKAGSHCYGTNVEGSDVDVKGVCVPPKEYILGFEQRFEQSEQNEPDMVVYSLQKFMNLASNGNPNIIEVLFTEPVDRIIFTPAGEKLYNSRHLFLSKRVKHSFSGYAISQLKRMRSHRSWLLNPPKKKPERSDFGLENHKKMSASIQGAFNKLIEDGAEFDTVVMTLFEREKAYMNALNHYKQYENWKTSRNPARAELEAKYHYDTKHAYHLVRLLKMCKEMLMTGEVLVKRPDREELLYIRNGGWSYEKLINWAEEQERENARLYETSNTLPNTPNKKVLDRLCIELMEEFI